MEDISMRDGLAALAGQQAATDWYPAKYSHRHPTRKLIVFKLVGDDTTGLYAWAKDAGYPLVIKRGHKAAVQIKQHEIDFDTLIWPPNDHLNWPPY
jgi:hypothetical protein